jgi:WD40 repeat protein
VCEYNDASASMARAAYAARKAVVSDAPAARVPGEPGAVVPPKTEPSPRGQEGAPTADAVVRPETVVQGTTPHVQAQGVGVVEPRPSAVSVVEPRPLVDSDRPTGGAAVEVSTTEPQLPAVAPAAPARLRVPTAEEQKEFVSQVEEVYELSKATSDSQKLDRAKAILGLGQKTEGNPAERFVLMRRAAEMAVAGGDAVLMVDIIDAMGQVFDVDPLMVEGKMLQSFAGEANDAARVGSLVAAANRYVDEAISAERLDFALSIAKLTVEACERPQGKKFRKDAAARCERVQLLYDEDRKLQQAVAALKASPSDAAANLLAGQTYCFSRGDWRRGLPFLAQSGVPAMAALAGKELALPTDPNAQVELADGWWQVADSLEGKAKETVRLRAGHWYAMARGDLPTGLVLARVDKRLAELPPIELSPDTRRVAPTPFGSPASGHWDPTAMTLLRRLWAGEKPVRSVAFAPKGALLAAAVNKTVKIWDAGTGQVQERLTFHGSEVRAVALNGDGSLLASGGSDQAIFVWDVAQARIRRTLDGAGSGVFALAFDRNGMLVSGHADSTLRLWNPVTWQQQCVLHARVGPISTLACSPTGSMMASVGLGDTLQLWDGPTDRVYMQLFSDKGLKCAAFSPDGSTVATGADGCVMLWEVAGGKRRWMSRGGVGQVQAVAFSRDGAYVVTAGGDRALIFWNSMTGDIRSKTACQPADITSIAFSRDGSLLACASTDETIGIWGSAQTGSKLTASKAAVEGGTGKEMTFQLGNGVTLELVLVPTGSAMLGSSDSERARACREAGALGCGWAIPGITSEARSRAVIAEPFYIGKYEVTQEQWKAVTGHEPSGFKGPRHPVEKVSWRDCQTFLARLNERAAKPGWTFGLPSDSQWEYACRAGSPAQFSFGDDAVILDRYGWFMANSGGMTRPVGQKSCNGWGLYDMHGNVWEWCADVPDGRATGSNRVVRGGGCKSHPFDCRSARRQSLATMYSDGAVGLRVTYSRDPRSSKSSR